MALQRRTFRRCFFRVAAGTHVVDRIERAEAGVLSSVVEFIYKATPVVTAILMLALFFNEDRYVGSAAKGAAVAIPVLAFLLSYKLDPEATKAFLVLPLELTLTAIIVAALLTGFVVAVMYRIGGRTAIPELLTSSLAVWLVATFLTVSGHSAELFVACISGLLGAAVNFLFGRS